MSHPTRTAVDTAELAARLAVARRLAGTDDARGCEAAFEHVLTLDPGHVEALTALAQLAMARRDALRSVALLTRARDSAPRNAALARSHGVALAAADRLDEAEVALRAAIAIDPGQAPTHLHLGHVLNRLGRRDEASRTYFRAVRTAQAQGQWRDDASTPPRLHDQVLAAMQQAEAHRGEVFGRLVEELRARHGTAAMRRVEQALAGYWTPGSLMPGDSRQRPLFLFFPGLAATPFHRRERFDWIERLERDVGAIRAEALARLEARDGLEPFLVFERPEQAGAYLGGANPKPAWDAYFFFRHGQRFDAHHAECPATSAALARLPLVRIDEHAPEICFSVLAPGSHILPHSGVTNVRLVAHLPLIVPGDCVLRAGGEEHEWREGEVVVFDDTFEHEAWNRSPRTRVILLMDCWHPDLAPEERSAITTVVESIGAFNRG